MWKKQSGTQEEHTEWHAVVVWDKLADFSNEYLCKGQLVSVEGVLRSRQWENNAGEKRKVVEVVCSNIVPLEWKK